MDHTRFLRTPALLKSEGRQRTLSFNYMCAFHAMDSYRSNCIFTLQIPTGGKKSPCPKRHHNHAVDNSSCPLHPSPRIHCSSSWFHSGFSQKPTSHSCVHKSCCTIQYTTHRYTKTMPQH